MALYRYDFGRLSFISIVGYYCSLVIGLMLRLCFVYCLDCFCWLLVCGCCGLRCAFDVGVLVIVTCWFSGFGVLLVVACLVTD